jgi:hypothetical protein
MTRRETLIENYENACFALLIDGVSLEEGKQLIKENEVLRESGETAVSDSLIEKCIDTIRHAFSKNKCRDVVRIGFKALNHVAVAAVIVIVLFMSEFAVFPELRVRTLNLLIEMSDVSASLALVNESEKSNISANRSLITDGHMLMGYSIPDMPEGFFVVDEGSERQAAWTEYENNDGADIFVSISDISTTVFSVDTENAEKVNGVIINGHDGLMVITKENTHIVWSDAEHGQFGEIISVGIDEFAILAIANEIYYVE